MRILLAEKSSFSERGIQAISAIAPTDLDDLTQEQLAEKISAYEILVLRLGLNVDSNVLEAGQKLCIVGTPTTGLDHIDMKTAKQRGVAVVSLQGERAFLEQVYATAEHTFALLLSLIRCIPSAFMSVKRNEWRRDLYRGYELNGKTLGLIGCGRLGSMVAGFGKAFGMRVLIYDPHQTRLPETVEVCRSLDELLEASDVVSLHATLNEETIGMLSFEQFQRMRQGAILINTARGGIINEKALLQALDSQRLAGAGLDVLCDEHFMSGYNQSNGDNQSGGKISHLLLEYAREHNNLIITPHIGGATFESVEKADLFLANKIRQTIMAINEQRSLTTF
jgi:D-3-phosphoglycerate dehydrogenase